VERMKFVICFAIAGLQYGAIQDKPFNPILGETFQGFFEDGSQIFIEQVSHHPPVSAFQVLGPKDSFNFYGRCEYRANFHTNSLVGVQKGPNIMYVVELVLI